MQTQNISNTKRPAIYINLTINNLVAIMHEFKAKKLPFDDTVRTHYLFRCFSFSDWRNFFGVIFILRLKARVK